MLSKKAKRAPLSSRFFFNIHGSVSDCHHWFLFETTPYKSSLFKEARSLARELESFFPLALSLLSSLFFFTQQEITHMKLRHRIGMMIGVLCTPGAWANQPIPQKIQLETELVDGTLIVLIKNLEKQPALVELLPGSLGSLHFSPMRVQVGASQDASAKIAVSGELRGKQVVHIETKTLINKENGILPGPSLYQPYFIDGRAAKKLSYEEAFLTARESISGKSELAKIDLGGTPYVSEISRLSFKAGSLPSTAKIEPIELRGIENYIKMEPRQLPKDISLGASPPQMFHQPLPPMHPSTDESMAMGERDQEYSSALSSEPQNHFLSPQATLNGVTIKGRMSLRVASNSYKAAWGWVVRAWQNVGGIWVFLGWTYVNSDGSWQLSLATALPGVSVRVEYQTKNRFVSIQDASGNPYTWGDNWKLTGSITDIGSRYADLTSNGDLPAVDRLYAGATQIWVKFYNTGMNALRDQPIQVFFPNTLSSGKCINNDGSGPYAWSCSYWGDGKIYIIPAHGSESVVQHEIGHSINSFYWHGDMPPGAGGTHNLWDCYTNGLALTEGFANFLTYWTQFDRGNAAPVAPYFSMNLENIPSGVCANQTAEMRVAATFWDLYDTHAESSSSSAGDGLHYINLGAPIALYLNTKKNAMSDYLPVVQSGQSSSWQNEFSRLFRLNKIIP